MESGFLFKSRHTSIYGTYRSIAVDLMDGRRIQCFVKTLPSSIFRIQQSISVDLMEGMRSLFPPQKIRSSSFSLTYQCIAANLMDGRRVPFKKPRLRSISGTYQSIVVNLIDVRRSQYFSKLRLTSISRT